MGFITTIMPEPAGQRESAHFQAESQRFSQANPGFFAKDVANLFRPRRRAKISRRSVSRVLSTPSLVCTSSALDGHSSGTCVTASLKQPTRAASRKPLCTHVFTLCGPPLFGLAPGGVFPALAVTSKAVRSYRTVSPLPWANPRRFVFCGTIPGVTPAGC